MRALLLAVVVAVTAVAGCDRRHPWPDEVQRAFRASCEARAPRDACDCTLDELRRRFTYEEFAALEARTKATGTPPPEFQAAADRCR